MREKSLFYGAVLLLSFTVFALFGGISFFHINHEPVTTDASYHFTNYQTWKSHATEGFFWNYHTNSGGESHSLNYPIIIFILTFLLDIILPAAIAFKIVQILPLILLPLSIAFFLQKTTPSYTSKTFLLHLPIYLLLYTPRLTMSEVDFASIFIGQFAFALGITYYIFLFTLYQTKPHVRKNISLTSLLLIIAFYIHPLSALLTWSIPVFHLLQKGFNTQLRANLLKLCKMYLITLAATAWWIVQYITTHLVYASQTTQIYSPDAGSLISYILKTTPFAIIPIEFIVLIPLAMLISITTKQQQPIQLYLQLIIPILLLTISSGGQTIRFIGVILLLTLLICIDGLQKLNIQYTNQIKNITILLILIAILYLAPFIHSTNYSASSQYKEEFTNIIEEMDDIMNQLTYTLNNTQPTYLLDASSPTNSLMQRQATKQQNNQILIYNGLFGRSTSNKEIKQILRTVHATKKLSTKHQNHLESLGISLALIQKKEQLQYDKTNWNVVAETQQLQVIKNAKAKQLISADPGCTITNTKLTTKEIAFTTTCPNQQHTILINCHPYWSHNNVTCTEFGNLQLIPRAHNVKMQYAIPTHLNILLLIATLTILFLITNTLTHLRHKKQN